MNGCWSATGAAQQVLIATSSAINASYFLRRAFGTPPGSSGSALGASSASTLGRRVAAGTLALLFVAIAVEAVAGLPVASTGFDVARRMPLLLATLAIAYLVSYQPRGGRGGTGGAR